MPGLEVLYLKFPETAVAETGVLAGSTVDGSSDKENGYEAALARSSYKDAGNKGFHRNEHAW